MFSLIQHHFLVGAFLVAMITHGRELLGTQHSVHQILWSSAKLVRSQPTWCVLKKTLSRDMFIESNLDLQPPSRFIKSTRRTDWTTSFPRAREVVDRAKISPYECDCPNEVKGHAPPR